MYNRENRLGLTGTSPARSSPHHYRKAQPPVINKLKELWKTDPAGPALIWRHYFDLEGIKLYGRNLPELHMNTAFFPHDQRREGHQI